MAATCPDCGVVMPVGAQWCPVCGSGATGPCPVCATLVPLTAELCPGCGTLFRTLAGIDCETCHAPVLRGALFCVVCGAKLSARQTTPARIERCPACTEVLPERRRHCIFCGQRLPG